jgi:glycosyltransferase involved in cell wall biosynthesis
METILFLLAALTLLIVAVFGLELFKGNRSIRCLRDTPPDYPASLPLVSVLIPARNEARKIGEALQSVLKQNYPRLEFIVVNDRSTDETGAILSRMATEDRRLQIMEVIQLPDGWLGKNYALYQAAQRASGDLLLFTDADVVMDPTAITRAVNYLRVNSLEHLAVMPEVRMPGILLGMFCSAFGVFLSVYARPWRAKDPADKSSIGIGAFNLVTAQAYRASGTHQAIAMRPDDDLKLGKLLKKCGYRQEMVFGSGIIHVEWYSSFYELIDGLMKNSFAGVEYSTWRSLAAGIALFVLHVWPFLALFVTTGLVRILNAAIVTAMLLLIADADRFYNLPRWYALGHPLGSLIFLYILWKSTLVALWTGSICWRGTRYPLSLLRANRV